MPPPDPDATVVNLLFLGGDYRPHRAGTKYGNKTDVMLLVNIVMDDPARVTIVQFPRNFYTPVEQMDDQWLFAVWSREGYVGLHYYFQQVFDVDLTGIFYIDMDGFVSLIDDIGGLKVSVPYSSYEPMNGTEVLAFLRDNDNNWGCPEYDCGNRQVGVLLDLAETLKMQYKDKPLNTLVVAFQAYQRAIQTDLSNVEQIRYLMDLAKLLGHRDYFMNREKLTKSGTVIYGDTPLDVRGWTVPDPQALQDWFNLVLGG